MKLHASLLVAALLAAPAMPSLANTPDPAAPAKAAAAKPDLAAGGVA